ncbi:hypothetical protein NUM3379_00950 [Kineococcus sp. NUM-3379]
MGSSAANRRDTLTGEHLTGATKVVLAPRQVGGRNVAGAFGIRRGVPVTAGAQVADTGIGLDLPQLAAGTWDVSVVTTAAHALGGARSTPRARRPR